MFKGLMTSVSGVRGVVGVGMTPEVALLWSGGFGSWVKGEKVVVGRDSRPTGRMLNYAVKSGLAAAGCDVEDVGIVPTPTVALAVKRRGAAGGIIITASHNSQEWNALKFVNSSGRMLTMPEFQVLEQIVKEGPLRSVGWSNVGTMRKWDGAGLMHIGAITGIGLLDLRKLHSKKMRVAIDCVNSAGGYVYPDLLEALGCEVIAINVDGSGIFPHPPEPLPENLKQLGKVVVNEKCVIGFAVDPDGDRLAIVDENGNPIGEELTLALAVKTVISANPGPVVVNSLTSQIIDDIAREAQVEVHRTRVGEANVSARMNEIGAVIGGEGNGGVMFPELHLVRDAGVGMALVLNLIATRKKKVSEVVAELPAYKIVKTSVPVGADDPQEVIERITRFYPHDRISKIDGLKVVYNDGWVQVRPSNTEPILRVFAESQDEGRAQELVKEMLSRIEQASFYEE